MKPKISFIYFDVGSVIIDNAAANRNIARDYHVDERDVIKIRSEHWRTACRGVLGNADYMDIFTKTLGITHPSHDATDFLSDYQLPIAETHALIRDLHTRYRMGIFSNAERGILKKLLQKKRIPDIPWEVIVDSSELGTIKPEQKIYEFAERRASVPPAEIFFVDDILLHLEAAKDRGWQGMVFDPDDVRGSVRKLRRILRV